MITADIHTHTHHSGDSSEPMENMIKQALCQGIKTLCFTEHMDIDFPKNSDHPDESFLLDTDAYYSEYKSLSLKYAESDIELLFGVELGLQPHLRQVHEEFIKSYPFDYIIGSEHITNKMDPYYPAFYEGRSEYEAYSEYFEDIITNLTVFSDINSLGHLDYIVRYGPNKNRDYSYSKYSDHIDKILSILISKGIALEVNSGGYKYGLGQPNPCKDILVRYHEMGGELLTIGSDAHDIGRIGKDFELIEELLKDIGYKYYCIFKKRKAVFLPLD